MSVQKRVVQILGLFMVIMLVFVIRLSYVQLTNTSHFSKYDLDLVEESIKQRTKTFTLHSGRGYFTDRNGHSLHLDYYPSLILFPFLQYQNWPVAEVAKILNCNKEQLLNSVKNVKEPVLYFENDKRRQLTLVEMKKINNLKIPGVYAQYVHERTENVAQHLIGVVGENVEEVKRRYTPQVENGSVSLHSKIGVSGLERTFDPFLISQGSSSLAYFTDNLNRPLFGFDVHYLAPADPYYPTQVVTTIDKEIQTFVTRALKKEGVTNGGAVIIDVKTNDLLALVSLPSFDIHHPFGQGSKNHMVTAYTPGSIFKIVVAAIAIDLNLIDKLELFDCNKNLYGDNEEPRRLGNLSFKESFSQSCNYTFSQIANKAIQRDDQIFTKYAKKLGLNDKVGWMGDIYRLKNVAHFPEEEEGVISLDNKEIGDMRAITQTAIGQKNVRITPLAVANMMATISRGGEKQQVRSATKITYENGTTVLEFPRQNLNNDEHISRYTAMRLQELLRSVVNLEQGTAHSFLDDTHYTIAGKTGTAQKGLHNNELNHWFAGYFPANHPKYAMVVVDLNHKNKNIKTLKTFQRIVNFLYEYDQRS